MLKNKNLDSNIQNKCYTSTGHKLRFYNQIIHCNSLLYPEFDTQFMPAQHIA